MCFVCVYVVFNKLLIYSMLTYVNLEGVRIRDRERLARRSSSPGFRQALRNEHIRQKE